MEKQKVFDVPGIKIDVSHNKKVTINQSWWREILDRNERIVLTSN